MQRKEKNTNCYYPTFLYMELDTSVDLTYLCRYPLGNDVDAAFLHEYIHYLQDVTTISGYTKICVMCDRLREITTSKQSKIQIPVDCTKRDKYYVRENSLILQLVIGDGKFRNNEGTDVPFPTNFTLNLKENNFYIERVHKNVKEEALYVSFSYNGHDFDYNVGEHAISEAMAYIIERSIYPDALPQPADFPYKVVDNIIETKYPFLNSDEIKVALCDVSLMHNFPGRTFYTLCNELEKISKSRDVNFIDVYCLGYSSGFTGIEKGGKWFQVFKESNNLAKTTFQDYFSMIPVWNDIMQQIKVIFDNAIWLRQNNPFFMIDILHGKEINRNFAFQCIATKLIGSLCIKTSANTLYHFKPDVHQLSNSIPIVNVKYHPVLLLYDSVIKSILYNLQPTINLQEPDLGLLVSLSTIHDILFKKDSVQNNNGAPSKKCPLLDWCKNSFRKQKLPDLTSIDYYCHAEPWNTFKEKKRLDQCSFGRLWCAWGLQYKKIRVV